MANPTMKKVESEVDARNLALIQELKELDYIWKSQERWRTRRPRSTSTASHNNSITSFDNRLFQNSPRALMSSLQLHHRKPTFMRVKNCSNDAVEEILMDRRAAIISGRFKGRQLFAAAEESSLSGGEISSDEVMMKSSESCSFPEEKMVVEVEKRSGHGRPKEDRAMKAGLGVFLIVLALVLFCMSCNANNGQDFILVPT